MSLHALVSVKNVTNGGVYYCADFTITGAQPTWTKLTTTGLPSLLLEYFRVDYGDPINKQYCKIGNSIYYRDGGNWSEIINLAIAAAAAGADASGATLYSLWTDPTTPGSVYTIFMTDNAVGGMFPFDNGEGYVLKSLNYGATWTAYLSDTGRQGMGEVVAIGNHIWVSSHKLVLAAGSVNYSNDGGATWKGRRQVTGAASPSLCILPHAPNSVWAYCEAANEIVTWNAGYTARTPSRNINWLTRTDYIAFMPDGSYSVAGGQSSEYYYSTDDFVTDTEVNLDSADNLLTYALTFPYNASVDTGIAYALLTSRMIDAVPTIGASNNSNRSGTNTNTPPYTDAIPNVQLLSEYGIWYGYPPADTGVHVFSVEEGDITDIYYHAGLGIPMFGDRSSWRDYDADDDGTGTPLSYYHAEDIRDEQPQRHNPWPATAGTAPVSDGSKWVPTDIITQAEFDYSFYIGGGHCPVTLDADAALILDLQGSCTPAQEIGLDVQQPTYVFIGPSFLPPDEPTFRPMYIEELANVTTTAPIGDGEVLTYDGVTGEWVNEEPVTKHNRTVTTLTAGSYTLDSTYDVVILDATAGDITITLPDTGTNDGLEYAFKRIDATANIVSIMTPDTTLLDDDDEILLDTDGEILVDSDGGWGNTIDGDTVQYLDSQYLAVPDVTTASIPDTATVPLLTLDVQ